MAEVMHGSHLALPISLELRAIPSRTMAYAWPLIALVLTMVFGLLLFALLGKDPVAGLRVFLIEPLASKRAIGEVLLKRASDRQGEVGFALGRDHQGQGYAAEAATAMLRLGIDELGFHRITAVVIEGNEASARLLGRLGFRQEARHVDGVHFKGAWATQLVFAILEDEWRAGVSR